MCCAVDLVCGGLYENCWECLTGVCCDDPITDIDTLTCKHWQQGTTGAPLDVCFGAFGGAEVSSQSTMYTCAADNKSVEYYQFTGSSSCDPSSSAYLLNTFDASS